MKKAILILVLLGGALGLRLVSLSADAPGDLLIGSREFQTDEGAYLHNAVHRVLFGKWFVENDFNTISHTPLYSLLHACNFYWLGVSFASARLLSVAFGTATCLLIFFLILKRSDYWTAVAGFSLLAFSHAFVFYNRLGSAEIAVVFFMTLSVYGWIKAGEYLQTENRRAAEGTAYALAAILLMLAGTLVKPVGFLLFPVFLFTLFLAAWKQSRAVRLRMLIPAGMLIAGTLLFLILWKATWVRSHWQYWSEFAAINIENRFSLGPLQLARNYLVYITYSPLFFHAPIPVFGGMIAASRVVCRVLAPGDRRPPFWEITLAVWYAGALAALGFFAYSPLRFNLLALPPACGLAGLLLTEAVAGKKLFADSREKWAAMAPAACWGAWQAGHGCLKVLYAWGLRLAPEKFYHVPYGGLPAHPAFYTAVFGTLAGAVVVGLLRRRTDACRALAGLAIVFTLAGHAWMLADYFTHLSHTMQRAGQAIGAIVRQSDPRKFPVLAGDTAPTLALENHLFAVHSGFPRASVKRLLHFHPLFMVVSSTIDAQDLADRFSGQFPAQFTPVAEYPVFRGKDKLVLYRIPDSFYAWLIQKSSARAAAEIPLSK